MNLPKFLLPALSLLFLIVVIYGIGSCTAVIPQAYRVNGPWVVETTPERQIVLDTPESDDPMTISLFSWGALFTQGGRKLGTLRYDRVNYTLRNAHNSPIWRMTSHDTYVLVTDSAGEELFRIVNRANDIHLIDSKGRCIASVVVSGNSASLFSADGTLLAWTVAVPAGMELHGPGGTLMTVRDRSVCPAGLAAAALPPFDELERAALMIMVK